MNLLAVDWVQAGSTVGVFVLGSAISAIVFVVGLRGRADVTDRTLEEREKAHKDVHVAAEKTCNERHGRIDANIGKLYEIQRELDRKVGLICGALGVDINDHR
jgi:hypothetical protein